MEALTPTTIWLNLFYSEHNPFQYWKNEQRIPRLILIK